MRPGPPILRVLGHPDHWLEPDDLDLNALTPPERRDYWTGRWLGPRTSPRPASRAGQGR